jgi:hypothetical protein
MDTSLIDSLGIPVEKADPDGIDTGYYMFMGKDSMEINIYAKDTLPVDEGDTSLINQERRVAEVTDYPYYSLRMFMEADSVQRLLESKYIQKGELRFAFRYPPENPVIEPLNLEKDTTWRIDEWNETKDTLRLWYSGLDQDSLLFKIADDTLVLDTVELPLIKEEVGGLFRKKKEEIEKLRIRTNIERKSLDLYMPLMLQFSFPVVNYDFSEALLIDEKDTIPANIVFADSLVRRFASLDHKWQPDHSYHVFLRDSIITDLRGLSNDTTIFSFTTTTEEDYGILYLNIDPQNITVPIIVQLMTEKEVVLKEDIISGTDQLVYEFLDPGKYMIKTILDRNRNGKWDTGDYIKGLQPEGVIYFPSVIEIRANWEVDETWIIEN